MSAAEVEFLSVEGFPLKEGEKPARFTFRCVRQTREQCAKLLIAEGPYSLSHGIKRDGQNQNGGRAQWDWDGNRDAPTFAPSVNCESGCGWHGYIRRGRSVNTAGVDEP
jgi:hypothetical protein